MLHQQKLVHIRDITSAAAAASVYVATGFLINADNNPSLPVARQEVTVELSCAANPHGPVFEWWLSGITTAGFTFNWQGLNPGIANIRIVAHVFHSICFDISDEVPPY